MDGYPSESGPGVSWVAADRYDPVRVEQTREGLPRHTRIRPPGTRESPEEPRGNFEETGEEPREDRRGPRVGPGRTDRRHRLFGYPNADDEAASLYTESSIDTDVLEDTQPQSVWEMAMDEVCERVRSTMVRWEHEVTSPDTWAWAVYFDEFFRNRRYESSPPFPCSPPSSIIPKDVT
ncbi:hypothetical protein IMZ48_44630 [Candidatus Bathyarchaeota archaeon]|nr:hypothetical protein [Candidatus Bathyarchaeota archaeon]